MTTQDIRFTTSPVRYDTLHSGHESTAAVHAGARRAKPYHSLIDPIVPTSTYTFDNTADLVSYMEAHLAGKDQGRVEYGRYGNPTVSAVEERLAALEGAEQAVLLGSGMASITTTLLTFLSAGDELIITDDCYRRTRQFCKEFLKKLKIGCTVVPMGDYTALERAIGPRTRLLVSETPTNPYLRVLDVERFAQIGRQYGIPTLVDSTFATPFNLQPLSWGIDLVAHSATKYLGGHNDLLAGVVAGSREKIAAIRETNGVMGAVSDANTAYFLLRGLKTLGVRVRHQNDTGLQVAQFLAAHPAIERVWYPGLPSHPDHETAVRQMSGFGGVVSFTVRGDLRRTAQFVDALQIPYISPSLGGTESLVGQPALVSYYPYSPEERRALGIGDNLVRLALGLEDADDLIADLKQALAYI